MFYKIYGGFFFYQCKEIKDIIVYFCLVVNFNDEEVFKWIINYLVCGIGDIMVGKIIIVVIDNNVSFWIVFCEFIMYGFFINKGIYIKLQDFCVLIEQFMVDVIVKNVYEIGMEIICQFGIINEVCQDNLFENFSWKENIEELVNGMNDFCVMCQEEGNMNVFLIDFFFEVFLFIDQDFDKEGDGEKVILMMVYFVKGLEFCNVFVVGMEENFFFSGMVGDLFCVMEEE